MRDIRWVEGSLIVALMAVGLAAPAFGQSAPAARRGCEERQPASLTQLFTGTVGNFKALPSRQNGSLLTVGLVSALATRPVDDHVSRSFSNSNSLEETFEAGRVLGGTPLQLGAAFLTYGLGRTFKSRCAVNVATDLIQAQMMAEVLSFGVKHAVGRTRPDGSARSFPSGHTTVSFASATVLQKHFGWKVGLPAYGVASYVAASRVQSKRHYLSDVAFGAMLGIVAGRTVTIGHGRQRFAVEPMAAPGGGGVGFTWLGGR